MIFLSHCFVTVEVLQTRRSSIKKLALSCTRLAAIAVAQDPTPFSFHIPTEWNPPDLFLELTEASFRLCCAVDIPYNRKPPTLNILAPSTPNASQIYRSILPQRIARQSKKTPSSSTIRKNYSKINFEQALIRLQWLKKKNRDNTLCITKATLYNTLSLHAHMNLLMPLSLFLDNLSR